jgi:hypothetical protein
VLVKHVFRPIAQLRDARVARPQLLGGVGDLVVIELVQSERLAEVLPHRGERHAQLRGRVGPELGLGEDEFVGRDTDALVGGDQGRSSPLRQIGILGLELLLITFALAPESGHASDHMGGAGRLLRGADAAVHLLAPHAPGGGQGDGDRGPHA